MRSVQTSVAVPLASVKPLDRLTSYRAFCLQRTRDALAAGATRRERCPVDGERLEAFADVDGHAYRRCPRGGSLYAVHVAPPAQWSALLAQVSAYRQSPSAFHADIARERTDTVYQPKLDWIVETLRLQGLERPRAVDVTTLPSQFAELLARSGMFAEVATVDEMELAANPQPPQGVPADVAILLESLDRVPDAPGLVRAAADRVGAGGLVFITALVASGFDVAVLGGHNLYLYPPDRTNCFTLRELEQLVHAAGLSIVESSTPGMLDLEIVQAHLRRDPAIAVSRFERQLVETDGEARQAVQAFFQQQGLSSFARLVARKT